MQGAQKRTYYLVTVRPITFELYFSNDVISAEAKAFPTPFVKEGELLKDDELLYYFYLPSGFSIAEISSRVIPSF